MSSRKTIADISLLGGHPALDFVNTVDAWRDRWGPDFLATYDDLVVWAERVGLIDQLLERRGDHCPIVGGIGRDGADGRRSRVCRRICRR